MTPGLRTAARRLLITGAAATPLLVIAGLAAVEVNTIRGVAALLGAIAAALLVPIGTPEPFAVRRGRGQGLRLIAAFVALFVATMTISALVFLAAYPFGGLEAATLAGEAASAIGIYAIGAVTSTVVVTAIEAQKTQRTPTEG